MSLRYHHEGSLWMGNIDDYMDEAFITEAFAAMDETVHAVKHIKNKFTGAKAGYCFVHFKDGQTAVRVMHKLNGKMMPHTQPPVRFMLNESNALKKESGYVQEYSIWVGDLDKSVDDNQLFLAFASRYSSVKAAKVVREKGGGESRGYAFVRFGSEEEHKDALTHMNGFDGLDGEKPIRVSVAVPRKVPDTDASVVDVSGGDGGAGDYSAYYDQYWYNYQAWQQQQQQQPQQQQQQQQQQPQPQQQQQQQQPQQLQQQGWHMNTQYDASSAGYQGYSQQPSQGVQAMVAAAAGAPTAAPVAAVPTPAAAVQAPAAATPTFAVPAPVAAHPVAAVPAPGPVAAAAAPAVPAATSLAAALATDGTQEDDGDQVVEHDVPADLEGQNQEYVRRNEEFWDALDASRWLQPDTLNPALELFIKT